MICFLNWLIRGFVRYYVRDQVSDYLRDPLISFSLFTERFHARIDLR